MLFRSRKVRRTDTSAYEEGRESEILLVEPGMVYSNSQTQWVINAPEPGTYDIICTVSGHYPFMKGQLIITP